MKPTNDFFAHLVLYTGLTVGILAVYISRFDANRQFAVVLILVVFYLLWGYWYHTHVKADATKKLFLEYFLIALIAISASILVFLS